MHPFSENLKFLFSERQLDHHSFAARLGCSPGDLQAWMDGNSTPNLHQLLSLSAIFQVSADRLLKQELWRRSAAKDIRLLVLDVDGVLTDGGIYLTEKGDEIKKFHARDGRGIMTAQKSGIEVAFLSGGVNTEAIRHRAERLGVKRWYVGKAPKTEILEAWLKDSGLSYPQVAYIGDDANDLGVIAKAGLTACPADAANKNRESVDIILELNGGMGCVREFIEDHLGVTVD
jgi:3-deoxy-D-manno-octulosonate 8-phosphate phosphatase (KDO 8-P phosphatase)